MGSATDNTYKVSLDVSGSLDFLDIVKASLKDTQTWQWTNRYSQQTSSSTSQSATATITGPAYGYMGPVIVRGYLDTIYNTFAFDFLSLEDLKGLLYGTSGKSTATEVRFVGDTRFRPSCRKD